MLAAILLDADDTSLKIGFVFGLLMIMGGSAFAGKMAVEIFAGREKLWGSSGLALVVAIGFVYFGACASSREYGFLTNYIYVEGITLGPQRCGKYKGADFAYTYDGVRYTKCGAVGSSKDLLLTGGRYWVRVWKGDPGGGRMDFDKPVEEE